MLKGGKAISEVTKKTFRRFRKYCGYHKNAYTNPMGYASIGYGRDIAHRGVNRKEADILLRRDFVLARDFLYRTDWYGSLDEVRKSALIVILHLAGQRRFQRYIHVLDALAAHDFELAAAELQNTDWADLCRKHAVHLIEEVRTGVEVDKIT